MSLNDSLAMALSALNNAQKASKKSVVVKPLSKTLRKVFSILNEQGYIGAVEEVNDGKGGVATINLLGTFNNCGVIKPRFSVKLPEYGKWEKRYLPAKDFGVLVVSTPKGIMTHIQAKEQRLGGQLIAYCY